MRKKKKIAANARLREEEWKNFAPSVFASYASQAKQSSSTSRSRSRSAEGHTLVDWLLAEYTPENEMLTMLWVCAFLLLFLVSVELNYDEQNAANFK